MGDWIDDLEARATKEAAERTRQEEIRLHNARLIRAKAPGFFNLLLQRIKSDCERLREKFPNDSRYHPFVNEERPSGFSLNGSKMPRRILGFDLNVDAHRIDVCERVKHSREDQPFPRALAPIDITVGNEDELKLTFRGNTHDTPESLAHQLISYACELS